MSDEEVIAIRIALQNIEALLGRGVAALETIAVHYKATGVPERPGDVLQRTRRQKIEADIGRIEAEAAGARTDEAAGMAWPLDEPRERFIQRLDTAAAALRAELAKFETDAAEVQS